MLLLQEYSGSERDLQTCHRPEKEELNLLVLLSIDFLEFSCYHPASKNDLAMPEVSTDVSLDRRAL